MKLAQKSNKKIRFCVIRAVHTEHKKKEKKADLSHDKSGQKRVTAKV